ncbi:hypothetical protein D3C86_1604060 [compost metagenome]
MVGAVTAEELEHIGHHQRADDARHVQREKHQALQVEQARHGAFGDECADQQRIHG